MLVYVKYVTDGICEFFNVDAFRLILQHFSVLTDFGLARIMSQTNSIGTRTMLAGSPGFQPPEQLRSEFIGPACDVYAFGGVTTITLTEKVLWPGLNAFQIMQKITLEGQKPATNGMLPKIKDMCFSEVKDRPKIRYFTIIFVCHFKRLNNMSVKLNIYETVGQQCCNSANHHFISP